MRRFHQLALLGLLPVAALTAVPAAGQTTRGKTATGNRNSGSLTVGIAQASGTLTGSVGAQQAVLQGGGKSGNSNNRGTQSVGSVQQLGQVVGQFGSFRHPGDKQHQDHRHDGHSAGMVGFHHHDHRFDHHRFEQHHRDFFAHGAGFLGGHFSGLAHLSHAALAAGQQHWAAMNHKGAGQQFAKNGLGSGQKFGGQMGGLQANKGHTNTGTQMANAKHTAQFTGMNAQHGKGTVGGQQGKGTGKGHVTTAHMPAGVQMHPAQHAAAVHANQHMPAIHHAPAVHATQHAPAVHHAPAIHGKR